MSFTRSIGCMRNPPDGMSKFNVGSIIPLIILNLNISREVVGSEPVRPLLPIRYRLNALATHPIKDIEVCLRAHVVIVLPKTVVLLLFEHFRPLVALLVSLNAPLPTNIRLLHSSCRFGKFHIQADQR